MSNNDSGPQFPAFDPSDAQTYHATCHCGTVQYTVTLSPPLTKQKVVECNCSICSRNGYLLVYPQRSQFVLKSGEDALRSYSFGPKRNEHKFCGTCGCALFFELLKLDFSADPPDIVGVNVRMFKDVDFKTLQIQQWDGWNKFPFVGTDHLK